MSAIGCLNRWWLSPTPALIFTCMSPPCSPSSENLLEQHSDVSTEIANLTFAVAAINVWNRLGVSMRPQAPRRS